MIVKLMQKHLDRMIWIFGVFSLLPQKNREGYCNSIWWWTEERVTVMHFTVSYRKVGLTVLAS